MDLYRVAKKAFATDLSGEGARGAGGRWNPVGLPVVYTAEHSSLAALEIMAHFDRSCAPTGLQLATITIPDTATIYSPSQTELPTDWDARPGRMSTVEFGREWLERGETSVLKVPSIVTPYGKGWNFVLNPLHPELIGKITVEAIDWDFDPRLYP